MPDSDRAASATRFAMRLSLAFGVLMLVGKGAAAWVTGSSAILSDASESVIHVVAVAFAAYSLRLSHKPADTRFRFGYDRITFFSAGFEGALIVFAALGIIVIAVSRWIAGIELQRLSLGTLVVLAASLVNLALGMYLVQTGKRHHSLILEANGKHVLTDSWTSFGVIAGLCLVLLTGWKPFDPLCAILFALNILWSGGRLVWRSAQGLMDYADPEVGRLLDDRLASITGSLGIAYHGVRFHETGGRIRIHVHLLFPYETPVGRAHDLATQLERDLGQSLGRPTEVVTHLEALEDHGEIHVEPHFTGPPGGS